jgi:hypothetical protein
VIFREAEAVTKEVQVASNTRGGGCLGWFVAAATLVAVAAVLLRQHPPDDPPPAPSNVRVPALVGASETNARSSLARLGLTVAVRTRPDSAPTNTVIDQQPPAGTSVADGNTVTLIVSSGPAPVPAAPELVGPADGSELTNLPRNALLTWRSVQNARSYTVEIQCEMVREDQPDCQERDWRAWKTDTTTATQYAFTWNADAQGRWRVTALNEDGVAGPPSPWWTFTFFTVLHPPSLILPLDGSRFHGPEYVTFIWSPVAGAAHYICFLHIKGADGQWYIKSSVTTPATETTIRLPTWGTFRWAVEAVDTAGRTGQASAYRTFTVES